MFENFIILGAGLGTRLGDLTKDQCKPMVKHKGKPLIDHTIDSLPKNAKISVTYSYKPDDLLLHLKDRATCFINTNGKGNAAFLNNPYISFLHEPVVIVPCDIQFKIDWEKLFHEYLYSDSYNCIVKIPEFWGNGDHVFFDEKGFVTKISREDKGKYKASGIQILVPNTIVSFDEDFYGIWKNLITFKLLKVLSTEPVYWNCIDESKDILV